MADYAHDSDADLIASGREPPDGPGRPWPRRLIRLLVITETAALAASIAVMLHHRPEAAGAPASPALPEVTSRALRLPAGGTIAGLIVITAAAQPGAPRAQFTVSALITGARPGTVYDLTGDDCSDEAATSDHIWAAGRTDAAGTADLAGHAWTGSVTDEDWLTLTPSAAGPAPGLRGEFARGKAAPFPAGQAPCAPRS